MATFDVFVEGPVVASPEAVQRLAEVMSQRYGLPAVDLVARMAKGRFRVKGNIDQATADTYARDLESIGARVTISENRRTGSMPPANVNVVPRASVSTPPANAARSSQPAPRQPTPASPQPAAKAPLPPASPLPPAQPGKSQPLASPLPPRATAAPPPTTSGLSAAFTEKRAPSAYDDTDALSLALEGDALALGSLDDPAELKASVKFAAPSGSHAPVDSQPSSTPTKPTSRSPKDRPRDVPLDLFAPPGSESPELGLELAVEDRKPALAPPPPAPKLDVAATKPSSSPPTSPVLQRKSAPAIATTHGVTAERPRWQFAAGVLLATVLGFVPAHIVATVREGTYDSIDEVVRDAQIKVGTAEAPVAADQLEEFRAEQLARKHAARTNIALVALAIWAISSGLLAYAWFKLLFR